MNSQTKTPTKTENNREGKGPKYHINIEGETYPWDKDTITTEEIITLGGWEPAKGAMVIELKTNEQRNLQPGEVIEVKPGMGFAKKITFKRG